MKLTMRLPCVGPIPAVGDEFKVRFGAVTQITEIETVVVQHRSELVDIGPNEKMLVTAYTDVTVEVPDFEPFWTSLSTLDLSVKVDK